jgi:hypothetical protein
MSKFLLENARKSGSLPPLLHAEKHPTEGFHPADVLAGLREIRATEPESSGLAREIRSDREVESLARWADAKGICAIEDRPPRPDDLTGGEHLVTLDPSGGIVYKTTHPGKFGYAADVELIHPRGWNAKPRITAGLVDASPLEYLFRLQQQNELFGDDIRVMGVARFPQGVSVLTTQPFYEGARTGQSDIDSWFEQRAWRKLPAKDGAFYDAEMDLLIMDALPRNVLTMLDGNLMPFDVVIVRPSESLKSRLEL